MKTLALSLTLLATGLSVAAEPLAPIKLRTFEIRDVDMGGVVSHTMLVPEGWKAEGQTRWGGSPTPIPESTILVTNDAGGRVAFVPIMSFTYGELGSGERVGTRPPDRLGDWLIAQLEKSGQGKKAKLVSDTRDEGQEKPFAKIYAESKIDGIRFEVRHIVYTYEQDGVKYTEELDAIFTRLPDLRGGGILSQSWSLQVLLNVRGPADRFEKQRPLLFATARSLRTVPKWHTQMLQLRTELLRAHSREMAATIAAAAKRYDTISDDNMNAWRKRQAIEDAGHNNRINGIYEVNDFRDADGLTVKLPDHYKNYYSDGKGTYLLTDTEIRPGTDWTLIKPVK
jgi:hypothetical protein